MIYGKITIDIKKLFKIIMKTVQYRICIIFQYHNGELKIGNVEKGGFKVFDSGKHTYECMCPKD